MREWYHGCMVPTEETLKGFVNDLNEGHIRKERKKVTVAKLKIWWKNERQREKRIQQRQMEKDLVKEMAAESSALQAEDSHLVVHSDPILGAPIHIEPTHTLASHLIHHTEHADLS